MSERACFQPFSRYLRCSGAPIRWLVCILRACPFITDHCQVNVHSARCADPASGAVGRAPTTPRCTVKQDFRRTWPARPRKRSGAGVPTAGMPKRRALVVSAREWKVGVRRAAPTLCAKHAGRSRRSSSRTKHDALLLEERVVRKPNELRGEFGAPGSLFPGHRSQVTVPRSLLGVAAGED